MHVDWLRTAHPLRSQSGCEYTAQSVRRWLREDLESSQAQRVCRQVERLNVYAHDRRLASRYRGMESYHKRLPMIVSTYMRGGSLDEIADLYRPVLTPYGVNLTIDILCDYIAWRLNKGL